MTSEERLSEIIRADFEEDDVTCQKLNFEKLLKSDFIYRFLGFAENYDEVFNTNVFDCVKIWLTYNKEEFDNIKYFLMTSAPEYSLPFRIEDFVNMTLEDFVAYQEKCAKICRLLDEKKALYEEFKTFYE